MKLRSYRDLEVWKLAIEMVEAIYRITGKFPEEEKFGLTSQTRRAAVSIAANIAEGYGRLHRGDYLHHLSIARGSLTELETHLIIANRLGFITQEEGSETWKLAQSVGKMLSKLINSLRSPNPKP